MSADLDEEFITALFVWHEPNERTQPLIVSVNNAHTMMLFGLEQAYGMSSSDDAAAWVRRHAAGYAKALDAAMSLPSAIGELSRAQVIQLVVDASMLIVSVFYLPAEDTAERMARSQHAKLLLLRAKHRANQLICAADAGAVFG